MTSTLSNHRSNHSNQVNQPVKQTVNQPKTNTLSAQAASLEAIDTKPTKATPATQTTSSIKTIDTLLSLQQHIGQLMLIEPRFASVYRQVGVPSLRRNAGGFHQLMRAIVGQQLSTAAANSIWAKLDSAGLTTPQAINDADDETLKANGLSKQKIGYLRSLVEHDIDYVALITLADDEVIATLTAVKGIGKWTAQMYLLFSLGRADILAVDDLAIKVAAMDLLGLNARPTPKQLDALTEPWSPHRSAASLLLWAHYGWLKESAVLPV